MGQLLVILLFQVYIDQFQDFEGVFFAILEILEIFWFFFFFVLEVLCSFYIFVGYFSCFGGFRDSLIF